MERDEQKQPGGGGCVADAPPEVPGHAVLRRLGEGASSAVWLLRRDDDGTLLAGRVLVAPFEGPAGTGPPGPGALGAAADALGPIGLDHLVRSRGELVGTCAVPGHHHRVTLMDYLPGGSLAQVIGARGPLSPGETVTIITPLAQLLAAGHAAGLTHGDVSPGNVLFTVDGRPVLADWELAARPGRPGASGTGTDGFRDPGVGATDRLRPASDVYALAALAWFCLTGRVPGPAQHRPPLPVLVPAVPPALAVLLDRGMEPDPAARPRADELARGVFAAATPEPVDLHASVHASVRPELVTRREGDARVRRRPAGGRRSAGEAFRSPAPA
ncbi:protein kinase domain-containing protein, partial [Tersicoccus solisilvae]|uniref:protein kinase domain-containing protein n=1 Tax=Tersicoccus solisilvae TaxID=1882339 RepID=UPI003F6867E6